jgi:predicted aldo/keto reductase-like oxidoreductase
MLHLTEGLIDACIAAMKSTDEMEADLALPMVQVNAAAERELRTLVKYEMAGACHLCGDCDTACPEHIAVSDMIRYHAYIHQYNERDLARELYSMAGSDPAKVCSNCGKCEEICVSHVPVQDLLNRLSRDMA